MHEKAKCYSQKAQKSHHTIPHFVGECLFSVRLYPLPFTLVKDKHQVTDEIAKSLICFEDICWNLSSLEPRQQLPVDGMQANLDFMAGIFSCGFQNQLNDFWFCLLEEFEIVLVCFEDFPMKLRQDIYMLLSLG